MAERVQSPAAELGVHETGVAKGIPAQWNKHQGRCRVYQIHQRNTNDHWKNIDILKRWILCVKGINANLRNKEKKKYLSIR